MADMLRVRGRLTLLLATCGPLTIHYAARATGCKRQPQCRHCSLSRCRLQIEPPAERFMRLRMLKSPNLEERGVEA